MTSQFHHCHFPKKSKGMIQNTNGSGSIVFEIILQKSIKTDRNFGMDRVWHLEIFDFWPSNGRFYAK